MYIDGKLVDKRTERYIPEYKINVVYPDEETEIELGSLSLTEGEIRGMIDLALDTKDEEMFKEYAKLLTRKLKGNSRKRRPKTTQGRV